MHRQFIAAVAVLSLTITAFASAPARADTNDVGKVLGALAGLAIIGAILKEATDDGAKRPVYNKVQPVPPKVHKPHGHITPRPLPNTVKRKLLPQRCLYNYKTNRGRMPGFSKQCLNKHYAFTGNLPRQCVRRVWTNQGWRNVYGARCLNNKGYLMARR